MPRVVGNVSFQESGSLLLIFNVIKDECGEGNLCHGQLSGCLLNGVG